ncbi:hypothetical protein IEU95_04055 [Hoyosella rhizosphaerae]|uniref:Uncharacterized protein n=1 Tax=Hoyosella rhizosphaerae TaxID=1755582 RepID=A0A916XDX9_9ACTN|nr:hypothetical protein [Hoyosella rhizosphaerae]MBN4925987.1 hypothetical protein [Hoyosella rhizosphaerae]GGC66430.1 hypothetical protein GCM10011410_18770 [Hoyosella rhizosphaerae]
MRIYIPVTIRMLQQFVVDQQIFPLGGTAFAVTPALRESYVSGDDEELAEVAMRDAGRASLRLLSGEVDAWVESGAGESGAHASDTDEAQQAPFFRRAVLVADVESVTLRSDLDDAVVKVSGPIRMSDVASAHIDLVGAEAAVATAVKVIDQADLGDPDAEFALGDVEDHDFAWYATQELNFLLELL